MVHVTILESGGLGRRHKPRHSIGNKRKSNTMSTAQLCKLAALDKKYPTILKKTYIHVRRPQRSQHKCAALLLNTSEDEDVPMHSNIYLFTLQSCSALAHLGIDVPFDVSEQSLHLNPATGQNNRQAQSQLMMHSTGCCTQFRYELRCDFMASSNKSPKIKCVIFANGGADLHTSFLKASKLLANLSMTGSHSATPSQEKKKKTGPRE